MSDKLLPCHVYVYSHMVMWHHNNLHAAVWAALTQFSVSLNTRHWNKTLVLSVIYKILLSVCIKSEIFTAEPFLLIFVSFCNCSRPTVYWQGYFSSAVTDGCGIFVKWLAGANLSPLPLCPSKISLGLLWDWTWSPRLRSQHLKSRATIWKHEFILFVPFLVLAFLGILTHRKIAGYGFPFFTSGSLITIEVR